MRSSLPYIIRWVTLLPETLELLLNIPGIDISMKDQYGQSLLFSAARGNKVDNFQQLVNGGLDYNARGKNNKSLVHAAAEWGGVEVIRYLLSLKLDPNSRDENEWTTLHNAANGYGRLFEMEVLVEHGADVKAKNNEGRTALHLSAANCVYPSIEIIKYLIEKGAGVNDCDNNGNTPLHLCSNKKVWGCLIETGADVHVKNKMGNTPAQLNPDLKSSIFDSDTSNLTKLFNKLIESSERRTLY